MEVNLNKVLNYKHTELFQSTNPELWVRGGKNAGKTYSIADKLLLQPIRKENQGKQLKCVVVRKTLPRLKDSVIEILEKRAKNFGVSFNVNHSGYTAQFASMKFLFRGIENKDDHEKVKSITDVDFVWANEVTELREEDYDMLRVIIRGGQADFYQFIADFNPIGKTSWVYRRIYEQRNGNGIQKLHYTVRDNPWARLHEVKQLEDYQHTNKNFYDVYFRGEWGELEGLIYSWDITPAPEKYDEIFYGCDFGYSVDPAAVVRIYRRADEFWVEQVIYETELTNIQLAELMKQRGITENDEVYCDSAEPKSIQELYNQGVNAKPCEKGQDSVRAGIDYLLQQTIHIVDGSEKISREARSYTRKQDKDGNWLPIPIDSDNHAMDAIRYGIFTHCKKQDFGFGVI